ncbi:MAG TPA: hypothetical protein VIG06_30590 [Kofleriaceae bacterium]
MRTLAIGLFAFGCAALARPAPARACSVTATFIAPTNLELVAEADRIVVATAKAAAGAEEVELEVAQVLKGSGVAAGDAIRVRGSVMRYRGASKPGDFARARPGAYAGSCTAWDYAVGKSYVVLLDPYGGRWDTLGVPFARVNEEKEPIWLKAVEEYVRIGGIADAVKRRAAIGALIARGKKKKASAADRAIAADLAAHLVAPTPGKPFLDLQRMLNKANDPRERARIVIAIGVGGDPDARGRMGVWVAEARKGNPEVDERILFEAFGAYYDKVPDAAALREIGELYVALGITRKQERWPLMNLLIDKAGDPHKEVMGRALAGADDEEAGRLAAWFVRHPVKDALIDIRARAGGDYGAKWELALSLAGMGDAKVVAWAKRMIAGGPDDHRWVALYALARSPRKDADSAARKVIKKGGEDLTSLIQGYGEAHHTRADARLKEIGARALTAEQKQWLDRALAEQAER